MMPPLKDRSGKSSTVDSPGTLAQPDITILKSNAESRPSRATKAKLLEKPTWEKKGVRKTKKQLDETIPPDTQQPATKSEGGSRKRSASELKTDNDDAHKTSTADTTKSKKRAKGTTEDTQTSIPIEKLPTAGKEKRTTVDEGRQRQASHSNRRHQPAKINIDDDGSEADVVDIPARPGSGRQMTIQLEVDSRRTHITPEDHSDHALEGSDLDSGKDDAEIPDDNEVEDYGDDSINLFDEAVKVINAHDNGKSNSDDDDMYTDNVPRLVTRPSRSSSVVSRLPSASGPPTTDDDHMDITNEHPSDESDAPKMKFNINNKTTALYEKKLKQERPVLLSKPKEQLKTAKPVVLDDSESEGEGEHWLTRTNLILTFQNRTARVNLRKQSAAIKSVLQRAITLGEAYMVFGLPEHANITTPSISTMGTPLSATGLRYLSLAALIAGTEELGYDGANDIADRLERGVFKSYAKPLQAHVYHRLCIARGDIRSKIATTLLLQIKLDKEMTIRLLDTYNYIYPLIDNTQRFSRHKPFQSELLKESIRAGFFGQSSIVLHFMQMFESSHPTLISEKEIPASMIALAATAVHASLQQSQLGSNVDFAGPALENVYRAHMVLLMELRTKQNNIYHKVVHKMYKTLGNFQIVSGSNQTTQDIINGVDWSKIEDVSD